MAKRKRVERKRGGATYPCPVCGEPTHVLTTRRSKDGLIVVRRRQCLHQHEVFKTTEDRPQRAKLSVA